MIQPNSLFLAQQPSFGFVTPRVNASPGNFSTGVFAGVPSFPATAGTAGFAGTAGSPALFSAPVGLTGTPSLLGSPAGFGGAQFPTNSLAGFAGAQFPATSPVGFGGTQFPTNSLAGFAGTPSPLNGSVGLVATPSFPGSAAGFTGIPAQFGNTAGLAGIPVQFGGTAGMMGLPTQLSGTAGLTGQPSALGSATPMTASPNPLASSALPSVIPNINITNTIGSLPGASGLPGMQSPPIATAGMPGMQGMPSAMTTGMPGMQSMPGITTAMTGAAGLTSPAALNPTQSTSANPLNNPMMPAATGPLGGGDIMSGLSQLMSMLTLVLQSLLTLLQGGGAMQGAAGTPYGTMPQGGASAMPQTPAYDREASPSSANAAAAHGVKNTTSNASQKQRLDNTLAKIAKDPEGSKLLQAAKANGYTIEVGDPTKAGGARDAADHDSINGVTLPNQKKIIINPNAPNFDKTVVHELVHAATESDGNSQEEEGTADVVGFRIASRMDGTQAPGSATQIYQDKIKSYPNLKANNDIINSLHKLGISA